MENIELGTDILVRENIREPNLWANFLFKGEWTSALIVVSP